MTFDPTKPVQTRDGRPARILATDLKGPRPLAVVIPSTGADRDYVYEVALDGSFGNGAHPYDLVNVEPKKTIFVSLGLGYTHTPHCDALSNAREDDPFGHGVLKVVQQGGKLISAELCPAQ